MSDAKLPAEGVVVLAWWLAEPWPRPSKIMSGKWYAMFGQGWSAAAIPDDGPREYITLDHAKAAGRLAKALRAGLRDCSCFGGGVASENPDDHRSDCHTHEARAALSEIGT